MNYTYIPLTICEQTEILSKSKLPVAICYDGEIYELYVIKYKFPYLYGNEIRLEVGYMSLDKHYIDYNDDYEKITLWYVTGKTIHECDKKAFDGLKRWKIKS